MAGKSTDEFTFWKANQIVTVGSRSTVKIKGEIYATTPPPTESGRLPEMTEHGPGSMPPPNKNPGYAVVRELCDDVTSLF